MGGKGSRWNGGKRHNSSGAGEEGFPGLCGRYKGSTRNRMRPL